MASKSAEKAQHSSLEATEVTKYWQESARTHWNWSVRWGFVAFVYLGLLLFAVVSGTFWFVGDFANYLANFKENPASLLIVSAIAAIVVSLPLWVARIFVRFFVSEVNWHNDAKERVTMLETFAALNRDTPIAGSELQIVLKALFREPMAPFGNPTGPGSITSILGRIVDK